MISEALYRLACSLAPRAFRDVYGKQMLLDFRERIAEERQRGVATAAWYAVAATADAVGAALSEHISDVRRDLSFAVRSLSKTPVFSLVVVATLALGIGAVVAVFSVVDAVLLAPLPYPASDRLVSISRLNLASPHVDDVMSFEDAQDIARSAPAVASLGVFAHTQGAISTSGVAVYPFSGLASVPSLLTTLAVVPELGRNLTSADLRPGSPRVVLLSDAFWHAHFGGDPHVIGTRIFVADRRTTVVGILPAGFLAPETYRFGRPTDVLLPLRLATSDRGARYLEVVARLRGGYGAAALRSETTLIARRLAAAYPASNKGVEFGVRSLGVAVAGSTAPVLRVLMLAVAALLLIACANVANMLLARAASREREIAVRLALGAPRRRIVAQLMTETALLGIVGGMLGTALGAAAVRAFAVLAPAQIPRLNDVRIDGAVIAVALAATGSAVLLAGLVPSLALASSDLVRALKDGERGAGGARGRLLRDGFVVLQIALALALVTDSSLLARSFGAMVATDPGFRTDHLFVVTDTGLSRARYSDVSSRVRFYDRVAVELATVPGIEAAGFGLSIPFANENHDGENFRIAGEPPPRPGDQPDTTANAVSPGFFAALGLKPLQGRVLERDDVAGARPVVVVDEAFARRFLAGRALGRRITLDSDNVTRTVVGVVPGIHSETLVDPDPATAYVPLAQTAAWSTTDLAVRSTLKTAALRTVLADAYHKGDPGLPEPTLLRYDRVIARETARPRAAAALLAALALIALALALAGVYGVVSYNVAQRTHEFGIRMALGARTAEILRAATTDGARLAVVGLACGVVLGLTSTRAIGDQLYRVAPTDPPTYIAVGALLAVCVAVSLVLPALRAARVNPAIALRYE